MTEIEKAAGYLIMLKNEGYLDEEAMVVIKEMFTISDEEASQLFTNYKGSEDHKESVSKNLKDKGGLLVFSLLMGACFLYISWDGEGAVFSIYVIMFWLTALGLLVYLLRLLKERFEDMPVFDWLRNPATPVVILALVFSGINMYHLALKDYLILPVNLTRVDDLVLEADCTGESKRGKHPEENYVLNIKDNDKPFKWLSGDHLYCFNNNVSPDKALHAGDTISIWVAKPDASNLYRTTLFNKSNRIIDVSKYHFHFLDINTRNRLAQQKSKRTTNISLVMLMISFGAFIFFQNKKDKEKVV